MRWTGCIRGVAAVCVAGVLCSNSVAAAEWATEVTDPGTTVWCRWSKPIQVDGKLDEWGESDFVIAIDQAHMTGNNYPDPLVIGGDADCSGRVAFRWDGKMLYLAAKVRDDEPAPVTGKYQRAWMHDGLMVNFHAHNGLQGNGRYDREICNEAGVSAPQLAISYYQPRIKARQLPGASKYVARAVEGGYVLEAGFEMKAFGYRDPQPGDRLQLSLILIDRDPGAKGPDKFGQLIWEMGFPEVHERTRGWANLRLMKGDSGADVVARPDPGSGSAVNISVTADALAPGTVFRGVRILDAGGNPVATIPADVPLPKGKRLIARAQANTSKLAVAPHWAQPILTVDGKSYASPAKARFVPRRAGVKPEVPRLMLVPNPVRTYSHIQVKTRPPALESVTKDTYLAFLKKHVGAHLKLIRGGLKGARRDAFSAGLLAAVLYKATREPFYAEVAKEALASAIRHTNQGKVGFFALRTPQAWLMCDVMRDTGLVTEKDEPRVRDYLIKTSRAVLGMAHDWDIEYLRRGAGHSTIGPAIARYLPIVRYREHLPADEIKRFTAYYNNTWGDWWTHRDTNYNDTGYRATFLSHVFMSALLTGRNDLFTDPEAKKFWDRIMLTMAPNGAMPHYGDTNGWSSGSGAYIFFFEYIAAKTGDGRFRYVAHQLFDHLVNHSVELGDWYSEKSLVMHGVTLAWLVADDRVKPVAPKPKSRLLTRKELVDIALKDRITDAGQQIYGQVLGPKEIPDKIVFASSNRPEDLWAMIELCPKAAHNGVPEATGVLALISNEAVLTCNQGYNDEGPDLHNVLLAEDLEGGPDPQPPMTIRVRNFYDRQRASYARVHVADYHGWPLDEERQFLFGRRQLLLMKDVVTFKTAWMCRLGPCWQTQKIGPEIGTHWANTYVENLFHSGLGIGGGVHRWKNPAQDLLVFHPPQPGCRLEIVDRFQEQPWRLLPTRLRYVWEGLARKGQKLHFTTLLVPHMPILKPSRLVEQVQVLADTPSLTVMSVVLDDPRHRRPGRADRDTVWLMLNDTGKPAKAGKLDSDARQVYLQFYNGKPSYVMAEGGTYVKFDGQVLATAKKGESIDKNL